MFSDKVAPENLNTKRLDSDFYRPEYIEIDNTLSNLNCVKLGTIGKFFTGPFGSLLPSNLYLNEGIPLFRVGNVGQFEALSENFAYLAPSVHEQLKVSEVVPGDLLLVKASVGEKICKVPEWLPKANITQHIIGIRPNQSKDTDYISAFLFCYYGVGQLQRYSLGSIIQYLGITDAKDVNLYSPDPLVQKYIGDKVRQAEQLRAWAKSVQVEIKAYFDELMPDLDLKTNVYKAPIDSLGNRLDAIFYLPRYVDLDSYLATKPDKVRSLADYLENKISGPAIPSNQFYSNGSGVLVLQTKDIRENYIDQKTCAKITQENAVDLKRFQVSAGTLLMGMSGTIGRTALLFDEADSFIINQRVAALVLKDVKIAGYLCAYLNHSFGRLQLQRYSVGGVQANIGLSEITSAKILVEDRVYAEKISELFIESLIANKLATALTEAAKVLVESLIEGQLTEQQLIQAQQALEDGDNSLDQAILSKLSAEGYAIEGATPLFSDVDELYSLLEEATQAEAEE